MHTIRLRGPWELEPIERFVRQADDTYRPASDALPASGRAQMPADWAAVLGDDFLGRVCYRRTFQKPTGLEHGERVWLVVEPPRTHGVVELNRKRLGEVRSRDRTWRFDITDLLEEHNRLEIVVSHPALDAAEAADDHSSTLPGGLVGEVRLEIAE